MNKLVLAALLQLSICIGTCCAREGVFPGKGSISAWTKANVSYNKGVDYYDQSDYVSAAKQFRSAIELYPWASSYHCNLGLSYQHLGDLKMAELEIRKAVELDPMDAKAVQNLSRVLAVQHKYAEARDAAKKCLTFALAPKTKAQMEEFVKALDQKLANSK
jgi:Flp pilus assembly protein TadD